MCSNLDSYWYVSRFSFTFTNDIALWVCSVWLHLDDGSFLNLNIICGAESSLQKPFIKPEIKAPRRTQKHARHFWWSTQTRTPTSSSLKLCLQQVVQHLRFEHLNNGWSVFLSRILQLCQRLPLCISSLCSLSHPRVQPGRVFSEHTVYKMGQDGTGLYF